MNNRLKKTFSMMAAAAFSAAACMPVMQAIAEGEAPDYPVRQPGTYEAEELELGGNQIWTSIYDVQTPGYSGEGFVYLTNESFKVHIEAEEEGMYRITVRGLQRLSQEGRMQTYSVNGVDYTYTMAYNEEWNDMDFGLVRLKKGVNEIEFKTSYGYGCYDTITIEPAEYEDLKGSGVPCDPNATAETKSLMAYLHSVYGKHMLSGQQEIWGGGHSRTTTIRYDAASDKCVDDKGNVYTFSEDSKDVADDGSTFVWTCYGEDGQAYSYNTQNRNYTYSDYDYEMDYIENLTGKIPAIRGFDYGNVCPCYAWDDGVTDRMIDWAKKGGICTASWHINVPTTMADYTLGEPLDFSKTTYSEKTDFVTSNAYKEGTVEYEYFQLCIKNLAAELLKLQEAGVPVLFRPFHEAEGNGGADGKGAWFWWSKEGAEVHKTLWKFLYKSLTEDYGVHNLIWEENLYAWSDESAQWYVGDDYVDIVGFDKYDTQYNRHDGNPPGSGPNEDCNSSIFWSLVKYVGNAKMVAMPENSTIPSLSNIEIEHANWLYFCTWYDDEGGSNFISSTDYQNPERVKEMYQSDYCITLDELPEDLYSNTDIETTGQTTTEPTTGDEEILYGDADLSGNLSISDAVQILSYASNPEKVDLKNPDICDVYNRGDGIDGMDSLSVQKKLVNAIKSLPESYYEG